MKHFFLILAAFTLMPFISLAQTESGFGVKGGLNYNANGDYFESATDTYKNPERHVGYHVGVFGKIGEKLFFKPELIYTSTKSDYDNDSFEMQKLDAPMLFGIRVIGPLSVFGGPSFQYILDTDFEGVTLGDVKEDFTMGLNFGVSFNLNKIGIDLRYERGFKENEVTFINSNNLMPDRIDTRPDQLILSLSLLL